jgi:hypothetical protein
MLWASRIMQNVRPRNLFSASKKYFTGSVRGNWFRSIGLLSGLRNPAFHLFWGGCRVKIQLSNHHAGGLF